MPPKTHHKRPLSRTALTVSSCLHACGVLSGAKYLNLELGGTAPAPWYFWPSVFVTAATHTIMTADIIDSACTTQPTAGAKFNRVLSKMIGYNTPAATWAAIIAARIASGEDPVALLTSPEVCGVFCFLGINSLFLAPGVNARIEAFFNHYLPWRQQLPQQAVTTPTPTPVTTPTENWSFVRQKLTAEKLTLNHLAEEIPELWERLQHVLYEDLDLQELRTLFQRNLTHSHGISHNIAYYFNENKPRKKHQQSSSITKDSPDFRRLQWEWSLLQWQQPAAAAYLITACKKQINRAITSAVDNKTFWEAVNASAPPPAATSQFSVATQEPNSVTPKAQTQQALIDSPAPVLTTTTPPTADSDPNSQDRSRSHSEANTKKDESQRAAEAKGTESVDDSPVAAPDTPGEISGHAAVCSAGGAPASGPRTDSSLPSGGRSVRISSGAPAIGQRTPKLSPQQARTLKKYRQKQADEQAKTDQLAAEAAAKKAEKAAKEEAELLAAKAAAAKQEAKRLEAGAAKQEASRLEAKVIAQQNASSASAQENQTVNAIKALHNTANRTAKGSKNKKPPNNNEKQTSQHSSATESQQSTPKPTTGPWSYAAITKGLPKAEGNAPPEPTASTMPFLTATDRATTSSAPSAEGAPAEQKLTESFGKEAPAPAQSRPSTPDQDAIDQGGNSQGADETQHADEAESKAPPTLTEPAAPCTHHQATTLDLKRERFSIIQKDLTDPDKTANLPQHALTLVAQIQTRLSELTIPPDAYTICIVGSRANPSQKVDDSRDTDILVLLKSPLPTIATWNELLPIGATTADVNTPQHSDQLTQMKGSVTFTKVNFSGADNHDILIKWNSELSLEQQLCNEILLRRITPKSILRDLTNNKLYYPGTLGQFDFTKSQDARDYKDYAYALFHLTADTTVHPSCLHELMDYFFDTSSMPAKCHENPRYWNAFVDLCGKAIVDWHRENPECLVRAKAHFRQQLLVLATHYRSMLCHPPVATYSTTHYTASQLTEQSTHHGNPSHQIS